MRILIVTNKVPYPAKDGGAIATLNMAIGLASVGAGVTMLAINTIKHFSPLENIPAAITAKVTIKAVTLDTTPKPLAALKNLLLSGKPYNAVRFESMAFRTLIQAELEHNKFDIIQLEGPFLAPYIGVIRQWSNAIVVLRAHNLEHEIWDRTASIATNPLKKSYLKILAKRIQRMEIETLRRVDAAIPITDKDAQSIMRWNPSTPCLVAPTGLNESQFSAPPLPLPEPRLFHLGGLDWIPNQDGLRWFVRNCWPKIREAVPCAKFFIAGRNAPKYFIRAIQQPGVEFMGEVNEAQIFMQTHGVMVVPLRSGSGMRIKIIEGMAASTPIISTTVGAEGIHAENGKEIIVADSIEAMVKACISLLGDSVFASQVAQNGCSFAQKHFNNTTISRQVLEFYERLLSEKNNKNN